jgi:glycine oxidase
VATWDSIVVGGGIIGLSVAIALRRRDQRVLVLERSEPAREASWAAAGMLADCGLETPPALLSLASASAAMYPEFVAYLEEESRIKVDLREDGTLLFPSDEELRSHAGMVRTSPMPAPLKTLEPGLADLSRPCAYLKERSVDPRALGHAALQAAQKLGIEVVVNAHADLLHAEAGQVAGVTASGNTYICPVVINCAGAWAGQFGPHPIPTRPVKGQMLAVKAPRRRPLRHVVRAPEAYLVPRSDGRIVIGTTVEEKEFDKKADVATINRMREAAAKLMPSLKRAEVLEVWAGLRPGTPDGLPILGATKTRGYFIATGHFRDGILLAPVTGQVMAELICGERPSYDLMAFSPQRFV